MAEPNVDVDLDALAPRPIRAKLGGKVWRLPGDMPMELYFQLQSFEQRIGQGVDETVLLAEMRDELLKLLQEHQPNLKALPKGTGLKTLIGALPAIYGARNEPDPPQNRAARRSKKRTPSKPATARARSRATSR